MIYHNQKKELKQNMQWLAIAYKMHFSLYFIFERKKNITWCLPRFMERKVMTSESFSIVRIWLPR